jgi:flagellar biosynthesis/type III secretory pathway protein FliH
MRDARMEGYEEGFKEGFEEARREGALRTIVSFVVRHRISYEDGLQESGLSEEEFQAKILEADPNFQR